jgi:hypothetical protein
MTMPSPSPSPIHAIQTCLHITLQLRKLGKSQLNELMKMSLTNEITILCPHTKLQLFKPWPSPLNKLSLHPNQHKFVT